MYLAIALIASADLKSNFVVDLHAVLYYCTILHGTTIERCDRHVLQSYDGAVTNADAQVGSVVDAAAKNYNNPSSSRTHLNPNPN